LGTLNPGRGKGFGVTKLEKRESEKIARAEGRTLAGVCHTLGVRLGPG